MSISQALNTFDVDGDWRTHTVVSIGVFVLGRHIDSDIVHLQKLGIVGSVVATCPTQFVDRQSRAASEIRTMYQTPLSSSTSKLDASTLGCRITE